MCDANFMPICSVGAVALERLTEDAQGNLVYQFRRPWTDGTTGITLSPLEF